MEKKIEKNWKNWLAFLHGKGHEFYKTKAAKELYGKQLISLSEKMLWAMIIPFLGYLIEPDNVPIVSVASSSLIFFLIAMYFRHQGMKIIDGLESNKIPIYVPEK